MDKECIYCNIKDKEWAGQAFGEHDSLKIVKYGYAYMLRHGVDWYDEYDNYDIESEIDFCPKCGRKLK